MPRYFFSVRTGDEETHAERAVELRDDLAALAYACEIVRELTKTGGASSHYPTSVVEVGDETRPMVFSIPFLAASA
jgi:hypothetical protein